MRIDDDELRDLFRDESDEHLQALEQGLLNLELDPQNQQSLDEVYRAAHSLKGASAMIGVSKVETVVHRFEDILGTARRGTLVLTSTAIDQLCQALDAVRQFCQEAITGQPPELEVEEVLNSLSDHVSQSLPHTKPPAGEPIEKSKPEVESSAVTFAEADDQPQVEPQPVEPIEQAPPEQPPQAASDWPDERGAVAEALGEPAFTVIEDEELRDLFKVETTEQIAQLEQGLLRLEQNPDDQETLNEVFRAAHSLKGAARMLAISRVETVAHHFEETLGMARRGATVLTSSMIDRLYNALDSIRELCEESITGRPMITDLETVLRKMRGDEADLEAKSQPREPQPPPRSESEPESESQDLSGPVVAPNQLSSETVSSETPSDRELTPPATREVAATHKPPPATGGMTVPSASPSYAIDTIRVPSNKLDGLMSHAGELAVTRGRIAHRVTQVEQLLALWEQWNRDSHRVRLLSDSTSDDVTPRDLQQLREYLQNDRQQLEQFGMLLKELLTAVQGDDTRVDLLASQLEDGIRTIRLLPLSTIFNLFPRLVRDLSRAQQKEVQLVIEGGETAADKRILEELKDPLTHMIRNAIDHGLELPEERQRNGKPAQATLTLRAYQRGPNVAIEIRDDGAGIDTEAVKRTALKRRIASEEELAELNDSQIRNLIFAPGFSTKAMVTDVSGRGVGMDVVRANVEHLRGTIEIESTPGKGTVFRLVLPVTVATRRVLIVAVEGSKFAIPVESVQTSRLVKRDEVFSMQGRGTISLDGDPVSVVRLAGLLELPVQKKSQPTQDRPPASAGDYLDCIVIRVDGERFGFIVDELLDEQEVVLKPHGAILRRVRNVAGSTILETGEVCVTLNPNDLVRSALGQPGMAKLDTTLPTQPHKRVILLAEDSIVTRTQEKRILEGAGFEVVTAVDGQDAYNKLATRDFDAVVSDVEMPNMTGLDLTAKIREQSQYKHLPVILVTSLASDEDRKRGMEVGADAYLTKPGFDQTALLETIRRFA